MIPKWVREKLRRLAEGATPGERTLLPRNISLMDKINQGAHPMDVAAGDAERYLGWEVQYSEGFTRPDRGEFHGPDAAFLMATGPKMILDLLDEIDRLEQA